MCLDLKKQEPVKIPEPKEAYPTETVASALVLVMPVSSVMTQR